MNITDTVAVQLTFSQAQIDALERARFTPEQTHRNHAPNQLGAVYVYECEESEMLLHIFETDGTRTIERREFSFYSGWAEDTDE